MNLHLRIIFFLVTVSLGSCKNVQTQNDLVTSNAYYVCLPCGSGCDSLIFDTSGLCPHCQMELVDHSVLEDYYTSIDEYKNNKQAHFTFQKEPDSFKDFHLLSGSLMSATTFDYLLKELMDSLQLPALSIAVLNGTKTVYHQNYGYKDLKDSTRVDANTLFEAASISKPFFALTVLQLVKEDVLRLDEPLYTHYPFEELTHDPRHKDLTARMVLTHTTGLPNWRTDSLYFEANPGDKHIYSGEGFEYLGRVISTIEQKDLNTIFKEHVLGPYNFRKSTFVEDVNTKFNMTSGYRDGEISGRNISFSAHPAYGLRTNAEEFSNFLGKVMQTGVFQAMTEPQIKIDSLKSIGLGIFIRETTFGPKYYHTGNNSNRFTGRFEIYPNRNFGFVFFTNCEKEEEITNALLKIFSNDRF